MMDANAFKGFRTRLHQILHPITGARWGPTLYDFLKVKHGLLL